MSTPTTTVERQLSPEQAMLTDHIGNEVYASHYAERKAYRFALGFGAVVLIASIGMNVSLARRPIANRYIRIDEMGRAQAIAYSDLDYSPREGEVRTYLTDWANYRYTIGRDSVAKKYPLNYYFLSQALASQLMTEDNQNHFVSQVASGQIEQGDVDVKNVTIRTFLRLLIRLDSYSFLEEVANHFAKDDDNMQTEVDIVLSALDGTADDKLTGFALRLALTDHVGIPREDDPDLLVEAESAFAVLKAEPANPRKLAQSKSPQPAQASAKKGAGKKQKAA